MLLRIAKGLVGGVAGVALFYFAFGVLNAALTVYSFFNKETRAGALVIGLDPIALLQQKPQISIVLAAVLFVVFCLGFRFGWRTRSA